MGQPHEDQHTNSAQHEKKKLQQKRNCEILSLSHPSSLYFPSRMLSALMRQRIHRCLSTHTRTITTADTAIASPLPSLIFQAWSSRASRVKCSRRRPNPPQTTVEQNREGKMIWRWTEEKEICIWTETIHHWFVSRKWLLNHSCTHTHTHAHTTSTHLYCWWSLVLRVLAINRSASFSKLREYSLSISAFFLKKSCRSWRSWTLMSVCCSRHFCCSTNWDRISAHTHTHTHKVMLAN